MQCSILRKLVIRCCEFAGKSDFAQNCVFQVKKGTLEIRANNGTTGICINTVIGVDMKDLECAVNIYALEAVLKAFDSDADITIKIVGNKIKFESENDKGQLEIMDVDTVFYTPKPKNWKPAPPNFAEKLLTVNGMHFKTLKGMTKDYEDLIIIRGKDICQISRSVMVFESTETDVNISVEVKFLQKVSNDIDEYCVENNRLYFKNVNEWCMIAASSKAIPKYEMLFTEVQNANNSVISIDSDMFLAFCEKLITLKRAEELQDPNTNHSIQLEFDKGVLRGLTKVGSTQISIENNDFIFNFAIVADFIKAASHKQFLKEDTIELHVGKNMRLMMAANGTTRMLGVLCRV